MFTAILLALQLSPIMTQAELIEEVDISPDPRENIHWDMLTYLEEQEELYIGEVREEWALEIEEYREELERIRIAEEEAERQRLEAIRLAEEEAERERLERERLAREEEERKQNETTETHGELVTNDSTTNTSSSTPGTLIGTFEATAYAIGGWAVPNTYTRDGTDVSVGMHGLDGNRIIAVDPNVIPLGTVVTVVLPSGESFVATARDTGGYIQGYIIDIFYDNVPDAQNFGRQHGLKVYKH